MRGVPWWFVFQRDGALTFPIGCILYCIVLCYIMPPQAPSPGWQWPAASSRRLLNNFPGCSPIFLEKHACWRHAADTAPWEGLLILRCAIYAIYDPLEGFNMLHMLLYDHQGGGGGGVCIHVLDEHFSYVTEHVHVAHAAVWWSGG